MTRRAIVIFPALPMMCRIEPDGARPVQTARDATAHVALPSATAAKVEAYG